MSVCVRDVGMPCQSVGDIESGGTCEHISGHSRASPRHVEEDGCGGTVYRQRHDDLVEDDFASTAVIEVVSLSGKVQETVNGLTQRIDSGGSQVATLATGAEIGEVLNLQDIATVRAAEQSGALKVLDVGNESQLSAQCAGNLLECALRVEGHQMLRAHILRVDGITKLPGDST